jgi:hypothetical protein
VIALLAALACHRPPAAAGEAIEAPAAAAESEAAGGRAVTGPGWWESAAPGGRLTFDVPAGFTASEQRGWIAVVRHLESGAELRVGSGPADPTHPGFVRVFADDGEYRSGPGGELAGTETWLSLALGGPTLVTMAAHGAGLYTELEIPLHAELVAWAAFAPILADLRVE